MFQAVPPGKDELPVLEVLAQETSRKVKSKVDGVWSTWCLVGQDKRPGVHFHGTLKPWEGLCMIHCNISCFSKCELSGSPVTLEACREPARQCYQCKVNPAIPCL